MKSVHFTVTRPQSRRDFRTDFRHLYKLSCIYGTLHNQYDYIIFHLNNSFQFHNRKFPLYILYALLAEKDNIRKMK